MASPLVKPGPRIVEGCSTDIERVMQVMEAAFADGFGEAWTRSQLAGILPMAGVTLWIADSGTEEEALGFALSRSAADEAELLLIAVDPTVSRQGIGRRLLDHFVDRARRNGFRRVHLEVRDGNSAVKLYSRAGFAAIGRRRSYYRAIDGKCYDAMTMALDI